jgi:hypothetical protein
VTALRESNILPDPHDVLDELGIPHAGFHAFRHGRCSFLVRNDVSRAIIRELIEEAEARARMSTLQRDELLTQSKILEKETLPSAKEAYQHSE